MATYSPISRYQLNPSGQTSSRRDTPQRNYTLYTVKDGDTLENLATRVLGNPLRYWEIADLNPQVTFPLAIEAGTVLRMPL